MVCVGGWVGEVQHPTLQSFKTQMAAQSHLSRSTALFSLALGLYPVLAMASQYLPSHTVYMHARTRTHTHLDISKLLSPCRLTKLPTLRLPQTLLLQMT